MSVSAQELPLLRGREVDWRGLVSWRGWYPVTIDDGAGEVCWRFLGERRLLGAFFQDDLAAQPSAERLVCRTPLGELPRIAAAFFADAVAPSGFVFHVSRCGSTLLTQMLAALPQNIVLSEPPVLDAFFRLQHADPARSGGAATLRALLAALGQRRCAAERHFVVKFDSWHTPWMGWLRELFPDLPLLFLLRQPDQVLASHRRQRGLQMVPGLLAMPWLRVDLAGVGPADLDLHADRVLGAVYASALDAAGAIGGLHFLDHAELPAAASERLLPLFGIALTPAELALFEARAGFHSKHGEARYEGDRPAAPAPAASAGLLASYASLRAKAGTT